MAKIKLFFSAFIAISMLSSCASTEKEDSGERLSVEHLYNRGHKQLAKTKYKQAAETFEKVELEYPYSKWATEAKLMGAYSHYKAENYDEAIMSLDRFIRFHPGNENIAYAYYLKAVCYFDQISDVNRDQGKTQKAMKSLEQLVRRFPMSRYAPDARQKIIFTKDNLAGQEMEVGRFYLNQHNYLSALNRFSNVVNKYQTTKYIEEALYRQIEIYTLLGMTEEAKNAYKILEYNYPKGDWTAKSALLIKG